jgi:copper(I)-binding protein
MKLRPLAAFFLFTGFAGGALAADAPGTAVLVTGAWSRATPPSASTAVVYMTITDHGAADSLISVSTPVAASAKVHESKTVDGVTQMRAVEAVPVTSAAPVQFAPGGYHVMLEGLKQPLKAGDQFSVTLVFEHAGPITAAVSIKPLGAAKPKDDGMAGMDMGH